MRFSYETETRRGAGPVPREVQLRALDPLTFAADGRPVEVSGSRRVERTYYPSGSVREEQVVEDAVITAGTAPPTRRQVCGTDEPAPDPRADEEDASADDSEPGLRARLRRLLSTLAGRVTRRHGG